MAVAAAGARGFLSKMLCIPKKHPFTFGMAFSCAKTSFAELTAAKTKEVNALTAAIEELTAKSAEYSATITKLREEQESETQYISLIFP